MTSPVRPSLAFGPFEPPRAHRLPIVGRASELAIIAQMRDDAAQGHGTTLFLSGDGGVGKTRVVTEAATAAGGSGWQVAIGRAYPLEVGTPYASFADALQPVLAGIDPGARERLTRGDSTPLAVLAPSLLTTLGVSTQAMRLNAESAEELKVRRHASIAQLLARLTERKPLLLVLENLQWADASSLELLHFLARQATSQRLLIVGTWNDTDRELPAALITAVHSLRSLGVARDLHLDPLTAAALTELVTRVFGVEPAIATGFAEKLHEATRGNAFFVEQTLRDLIERGVLRRSGDVWVGWHIETLSMPRSVRDLLRTRTERLGADAHRLAELSAVVGTSAAHEVLAAISGFDEPRLLAAIDELRGDHVIEERLEGSSVTYDIAHPMLRQALVESLGLARERALHGSIADALERSYGPKAERHAAQLAAHWRRADQGGNAERAIRWLVLAGRQANARGASREAADSLRAALSRADEFPEAASESERARLVDELARLYRRLGEYHDATEMCLRARNDATQRGDSIAIAVSERRLGLAAEGLARRQEAVQHFDRGLAHARDAGDETLVVRLQLAKADCLQALGLPDEAKEQVQAALDIAERLESLPLLARAHRMLLMLHVWSGPAHKAWSHVRSAVALAEQTGERNIMWSAHWAASVLGGLTSNIPALQRHMGEAMRLAEEMRSPLLQLRTLEIAIEYRSGVGEWTAALMDGERAIAIARSLDQFTMLARLQHWVGVVYLQRGELLEARTMLEESWRVSGADAIDVDRPFDVHGVLPAFVGRVSYLVAIGDYQQAIVQGLTALRIADRTGYVAWTVHRLLPAIADAALAIGDEKVLDEVRDRLARDAELLSHPIGGAWVDLIDGERARRAGDLPKAVTALQRAVSRLETVPFPFDAARARLMLAKALDASGERDEGIREARAALQLLESLGARPAAEQARALLREFGARVPGKRAAPGFDGLTARELDIVRLVAQRESNKEIGAHLRISARTVGTHLANVFDKVGVRDRTALGDLAREKGFHQH